MSDVDEWLDKILSEDAMAFEDAYWGERPPADKALPEILMALSNHFDIYSRGKLIELLGECEDHSVMPVLEKELDNPNEGIRNWARASIEALKRVEPWQKTQKY